MEIEISQKTYQGKYCDFSKPKRKDQKANYYCYQKAEPNINLEASQAHPEDEKYSEIKSFFVKGHPLIRWWNLFDSLFMIYESDEGVKKR